MKRLTLILSALVMSSSAFAAGHKALSLPGYFGSINNNSGYVLECSQVIGGYCANNPMPANGYIQMLPDPGSKEIRAHVMAFDANKPGHYTDNVIFIYKEQKHGSWKFTQMASLQGHIAVKMALPDTAVFSRAPAKKSGAKS